MTDVIINTQYEDLLRKVLTEGTHKTDRTGTGTRSIFGTQMRFNLQDGFPLITTKKVHLRSIIHELLWFINGDTNVKYLEENNVKIWDAWRTPYRLNRPTVELTAQAASSNPQYMEDPKVVVAQASYEDGTLEAKLAQEWVKLIEAHQDSQTVVVDERWHTLANFIQDAQQLPHWFYKNQKWDDYILTPYYYGEGEYSTEKAVWLTQEESAQIQPATAGEAITRPSLYETGDLGPVYGAMWRSWPDYDGGSIDQLSQVIEDIKNNPDSRRHIVSAWNPALLNQQALPPCHSLFQFYVADGKLSCQLYQRSCDALLGLPFNISSYSLLVMLIAQQTGLEPGDFVWTGGDTHIYDNHVEQVELQLARDPFPFPKLVIKRKPDSIFDYKFEDFEIVGYQHHAAIKAPVAV